METALLRCSTALLASAISLLPITVVSEPAAPDRQVASNGAEGAALLALHDILRPEADISEISWTSSHRSGDVDVYTDLSIGDLSFAEAKLGPVADGAVSILLLKGQGHDPQGNEIAIEKVFFDGRMGLLAGLSGAADGDLTVQDNLCDLGNKATRTGVAMNGLSVSQPKAGDDSEQSPFLKLEGFNLDLRGEPRDGACLARVEGSLSGLLVDGGEMGRLALSKMHLASFRPASALLPVTSLGEDFYDYWGIDDLVASWRNVEDALTLDFASVKTDYASDTLLPLSTSGLNGLMQMAMQGATEAEMAQVAQPHDLWNALREVSASARVDIQKLEVKTEALGLLPAAVLGAKDIDAVTFTGEMSAKLKDAELKYALFQTLDPLISMGMEVDLDLGIAEPSVAQTADGHPEFYAPIALKRLDLLVDDKGVDPLLRQVAGMGLPDLVKSQAAMLPADQRETVAAWITGALGDGNNARLRLTPDSPVAVADILPLLTGDWTLLGTLMNATSMP